MIAKTVLYAGDADLWDAAKYLGSVLKRSRIQFDYLRSNQNPPLNFVKKKYSLYVLSDYPSARLTQTQQRVIAQRVFEGASLLMIGGWGSFTGYDGFYGKSYLEKILPVRLSSKDDRTQGASGYRIKKSAKGNYFKHFKFETAPGIAGYNKVKVKPNAREILSVKTLSYTKGSRFVVSKKTDPLLVLGSYGMGRVGALTTDLAPHWSGGLVDWGHSRMRIKVSPKVFADIGNTYYLFVKELLNLLL